MKPVTTDRTPKTGDGQAAGHTGQYLVYFAAERTLMAWIHAALGFMALGFVIDRFGLVVRITASKSDHALLPTRLSFLAGAGLVMVGAFMAMVAAVRYTHFAWRYCRTGDTEPGYGLCTAIGFTVIAALMGALISAYLVNAAPFSSRSTQPVSERRARISLSARAAIVN
jgi:putative membrane protein